MGIFGKKDTVLIKSYKQYRQVGETLVSEIMNSSLADSKLFSSAFRTLGVLQGQRIVLEDKSEEAAMMDFIFQEYRVDGKTLVQRYAETVEIKDVQKRTLLDGFANAYTSLFKIQAVDEKNNTVVLQDLLMPESEAISLIDIGMSQSTNTEMLLFSRIVPLPELKMTSGNSFVFLEDQMKQVLLKYKVLDKKLKIADEHTRRYVCFFKLNRSYGVPLTYR